MRFAAFGTVRMDIHVYQDLDEIGNREEIKIDEMRMKVGGSVYNTASILTERGEDVVLYTPGTGDAFADLIHVKLKKQRINYIVDPRDINDTASSLIFVNRTGGKKMISYDGDRRDAHILTKLLKDAGQFDVFYTSFYEINTFNYRTIGEIMDVCSGSFVDLSPLIYEVDPAVIRHILSRVKMLSGTEQEYEMLCGLLEISDPAALAASFGIGRLYIKMGAQGARVYIDGAPGSVCTPGEKKSSKDTTGCGDTFNAGILYALSHAYDDGQALEEAVSMATRVAYEGLVPGMFRP